MLMVSKETGVSGMSSTRERYSSLSLSMTADDDSITIWSSAWYFIIT